MNALIINNTQSLWRYGGYDAIKVLVNQMPDKGGLDIYLHNNEGSIKMMAQDFKKHTPESSFIGILPLTSAGVRSYEALRPRWDELQLASIIRKYNDLTIIDYESYTGLTLSAVYGAFKILSSDTQLGRDYFPYHSVTVKSLTDRNMAKTDRYRIISKYSDLMERLAFRLNPRPRHYPDWSDEEYESWVRDGVNVSLEIVYYRVDKDAIAGLVYTFPEREIISNKRFTTRNIRHAGKMM